MTAVPSETFTPAPTDTTAPSTTPRPTHTHTPVPTETATLKRRCRARRTPKADTHPHACADADQYPCRTESRRCTPARRRRSTPAPTVTKTPGPNCDYEVDQFDVACVFPDRGFRINVPIRNNGDYAGHAERAGANLKSNGDTIDSAHERGGHRGRAQHRPRGLRPDVPHRRPGLWPLQPDGAVSNMDQPSCGKIYTSVDLQICSLTATPTNTPTTPTETRPGVPSVTPKRRPLPSRRRRRSRRPRRLRRTATTTSKPSVSPATSPMYRSVSRSRCTTAATAM